MHAVMNLKRLSPRTQQTYLRWIDRFFDFHPGRHISELGPDEVTAFLSAFAVGLMSLLLAGPTLAEELRLGVEGNYTFNSNFFSAANNEPVCCRSEKRRTRTSSESPTR